MYSFVFSNCLRRNNTDLRIVHKKIYFLSLIFNLNYIFLATIQGHYAAATIEEDDKFGGSWDCDDLFRKIKQSGNKRVIAPFESPLPTSLYSFWLLDYFWFSYGFSLSPPAYS